MRSVNSWLKHNWIAVVALVSLCMSTVVAAPSVFNGSLNVVTSATITDNNAANGTVPVVNSSHVYVYATPNPMASNACLTVTTPVNALSPVIGIANSNILATGCGGNGTGVPSLSAGTGLASSGSWAAQTLGLAAASSYTILANNTASSATPVPVSAAALAGLLSGANGCPPQVFTATGTSTDTSGTYTTPTCNGVTATVLWIRVVGGGGGGGGTGTSSGNNGFAGDASTFGASFLTANGGGGGPGAATSGGGSSTGGTASGGNILDVTGQYGISGLPGVAGGVIPNGGFGGSNPLGQGAGVIAGAGGAPGQGCGAGGGGGASPASASNYGGSGGASGGYVEHILTAPAVTYAYTAGKFGAAGAAGTGGNAGGNGAPGCIRIIATWGTL